MLLKSPGKVLEKSLNKRLSNLYEPCERTNGLSRSLSPNKARIIAMGKHAYPIPGE